MKTRILLISAAIVGIALMQPLGAATATSNVTVSAVVSATAKLTLSRNTVAFVDANPDDVAIIDATGGAVTVTAKGKTSAAGSITLTLLATGDLVSGGDTIAISNVTWTASGGGFVAGTMNKDTAQSVASWTGSGNRVGGLSFKFANSWDYTTGSYSASATYTLTAP